MKAHLAVGCKRRRCHFLKGLAHQDSRKLDFDLHAIAYLQAHCLTFSLSELISLPSTLINKLALSLTKQNRTKLNKTIAFHVTNHIKSNQ